MLLIQALRSLAFSIAFIISILIVGVVGVPLLVVPGRAMAGLMRLWSRAVIWSLRVFAGISAEIEGREHVPDTPCLIAAKHQSTWDTIIFNLLLDNGAFVLKRELLRIPIYGWYAWRAGHIPIDRQGGGSAMRHMLRKADQAIKAGRSVIIFPEGTRTAAGQTRPYHPGVAGLYRHLAVPVVPVAVNSGLFWGRRRFLKQPGVIRLQFLPMIPPGMDRRQFIVELAQRIDTATAQLEQSARQTFHIPS